MPLLKSVPLKKFLLVGAQRQGFDEKSVVESQTTGDI